MCSRQTIFFTRERAGWARCRSAACWSSVREWGRFFTARRGIGEREVPEAAVDSADNADTVVSAATGGRRVPRTDRTLMTVFVLLPRPLADAPERLVGADEQLPVGDRDGGVGMFFEVALGDDR